MASTSTQNNTQSFQLTLNRSDKHELVKNMISEVINIENKAANPMEMIEMTTKIFENANIIYSNDDKEETSSHLAENFLDSQLMNVSGGMVLRCSNAIGTTWSKYDKFELADHIKHNEDFWLFSFPLEVPPLAFLYGTFEPTPLPPRTRGRRTYAQRQQLTSAKVPSKADNLVTKDETSEMSDKLYWFLERICKDGPVSYFHFVLDPTSFSRSVENIYHLSFLVREGKVSVYLDDEKGVPFINTVPKNKRRRPEDSSEKQFIVSIDTERWRDLIEAFEIVETMFLIDSV